jgi:hypothetical protein
VNVISEEVLINLAAAVIFAILGALGARAWERTKLRRRYGHVRELLAHYDRLQIIVSSIELRRFTFQTDSGDLTHQSPRNVLFMPMAEGRAIAALIGLLHKVNPKIKVQLITASNHDPSVPTFAIGGPSVNPFSAKVLPAEFPLFKIDYPAAKTARYDGHVFETRRDGANLLTKDYGFIFVTRTARNAPCLIFCGVLAFGTAMAVELFGTIAGQSEAAGLIRKRRKGFIVAEGSVDGLNESAVELDFWRELPATLR